MIQVYKDSRILSCQKHWGIVGSKGWVTVTNNKEIQNMLGKVLEEDVVSVTGAILIPGGTRVTAEHVSKVQNHHWYDLSGDKNVELSRTISNAVEELEQIFNFVRKKNAIPLQRVYREILPAVLKVASYPYVNKLLVYLSKQDDYTVSHSLAVSVLSAMLGRWIGLTEDRLVDLTVASTLHDIGKAKIPLEILNKPGKLSEDEFSLVKRHTVFGYEMIKATYGTNHDQALAAIEHHERLDGSGYPFGIEGDQISLFARIIAIADVFHAMGSKRVYHGPKPIYEVLAEMSHGVFGEFDPKILSLFLQRFMESLIGVQVMLSDGRIAVIRLIHPDAPMCPLLELDGGFIDLQRHHDLRIERLLS